MTLKLTIDQILQQAITMHQEGKYEEAEILYRKVLEAQPTNLDANNNLGIILEYSGKLKDAEISYKKAIKFKPDFAEAYNNLGSTLTKLNKFVEAETNYKKAVQFKPDYVQAYYNLGNILQKLEKLDEAEINYKKAIELKPDYAEALNNLGNIAKNLGKFDEAETNYKKAIELKPDYAEAFNNLGITLDQNGKLEDSITSFRKAIKINPNYEAALKNLEIGLIHSKILSKILESKKLKNNNTKNFVKNLSKTFFGSNLGLTSNPFISNRPAETELINNLYKIDSTILDEGDNGYLRYGNGICSDFKLFDNSSSIIKKAEEDLIKIMKDAVKSDIIIFESFLNIFRTGSGIISHNHISKFDEIHNLINQKYSLTYYLSIGDQNCSEPGNLKLYDPNKEISLSDGMIVIFPSERYHSAVYNGKTDRVMIGINFYSLT